MFDYRFRFTDLSLALDALAELRTAGILPAGEACPANMLGEPIDANGDACAIADAVCRAAQDAEGVWHIVIRSEVPPTAIPFDPAGYGMVPESAEDSAAILGVWA